MGLIRILAMTCFFFVPTAHAAWNGPIQIFGAGWGASSNQLGIDVGDTPAYDRMPFILSVGPSKVLVDDMVNSRLLAINIGLPRQNIVLPRGAFPRCEDLASNGNLVCYSWENDIFYGGVASSPSEWIWRVQKGAGRADTTYDYLWLWGKLFNTSGTLITTTTERPLELGRGKSEKAAKNLYKCSVEYPDVLILWDGTAERPCVMEPVRVSNTDIMAKDTTTRYLGAPDTTPRKPTDKLRIFVTATTDTPIPEGGHDCVPDPTDHTIGEKCTRRTTYGDPVVGSDGAVYAPKYVFPGNSGAGFYVLKWIWVP